MSTPPETPSPRRLVREVAGLLLVAAGALVVLVALFAVHPVLSTSVGAAGTYAVFIFLAPTSTPVTRMITRVSTAVATAAAVGCAFMYWPLLGWVEAGAIIGAAGAWLASEGV
ncbi:hypothetical protein [Streptomyces sp. NPDC020965]|uniref:hypothetical protein n=1 Tax=Streptomyces sp. NPDC020965 TaxID=3365105 RepID=UPI00378AAE86